MRSRLVVLVSGAGTNLQALLDACADPGYGAESSRSALTGTRSPRLTGPAPPGIPTFVYRVKDYPDRPTGTPRITAACAGHEPDLVVTAGFMKLVGPDFLGRFGGRFVNTHPALLPSFPGMHGVRDALAHGVKVTGCTIFLVDEGIDSGPIIAQAAVPVLDDDDEAALHERIKVAERALLWQTVGRMVSEGWSVRGAGR